MKIVALETLELKKDKLFEIKQKFEKAGHEFEVYAEKTANEEVLIQRAKDAEVVIVSNVPLGENFIKSCKKLKMISVAFTGIDHIDIETCRKNNVKVCNAAGYSTTAVTELTIGMMISLIRKIPISDFATRSFKTRDGFLGMELSGKTIGIIGTGEIGTNVAKILKAFNCNVIAFSKTEKDEIKKLGIKYVKLDELLATSDIISLHIPLTTETKHLIGKEEIMKMKLGTLLINTSRGGVVDTMALAVALKMNRIAGAAVDVYDNEPPIAKTNPLRELANTVLLPHIGYATQEAIAKRADIVVENIFNF